MHSGGSFDTKGFLLLPLPLHHYPGDVNQGSSAEGVCFGSKANSSTGMTLPSKSSLVLGRDEVCQSAGKGLACIDPFTKESQQSKEVELWACARALHNPVHSCLSESSAEQFSSAT